MRASEHEPTFTEEARRRQILQAAVATVNELGYHRTSLTEIARRAGVAKSAVIYYLESKDALLLRVVDHAFTTLGQELVSAVDGCATPSQKLRAYVRTYLSYIDAHRAEVAAAVTILVSHRDEEGTPLYLVEHDTDTALLRSILSAGMDVGEFRRMPVAVAVRLVEALLDLPITELQRDLSAELGELSEEVMNVIAAGVAVTNA